MKNYEYKVSFEEKNVKIKYSCLHIRNDMVKARLVSIYQDIKQ